MRGKAQNEGLCSYGFNYYTINENIALIGYLSKNSKLKSSAQTKRKREAFEQLVTTKQVERTADLLRKNIALRAEIFEGEKDNQIYKYIQSKEFKRDATQVAITSMVNKVNAIFHDFRQYAGEVIQNINAYAYRTGRAQTETQLDHLPIEILTAYHAAKLMTSSLDSYAYTETPALLRAAKDISKFRVHSIALKLLRIYKCTEKSKDVVSSIEGKNEVDILSNEKAIPIIIHALIDNAYKYAPARSRITLTVEDHRDHVELRVNSIGPKINKNEVSKIFTQFYRGRNVDPEIYPGSGFGLYSLATISEHLGIGYHVDQTQIQNSILAHTVFTLQIPLTLP